MATLRPRRFSLGSAMLLVAALAVAIWSVVEPYLAQKPATAQLLRRGYQLVMRPTWLSKLTREGAFEQVVDAIPFNVSGPVSDEDAGSLASLPFLKRLSLEGMTDDQLFSLRRLTRLEHLELRGHRFTEPGLIHLLRHLTNLQSLTLDPRPPTLPLSDAGLAALAKLPQFQRLECAWYHNITDAGLAHLKKFATTDRLELSGEAITDAGLAHVSALANLRRLSLDNTRITDAGLAHLRGLRGLQTLSLRGSKITGAGLGHLNGLPLRSLDVGSTNVDDDGLAHLNGMAALESLHLPQTRVTDAGLAHLNDLPRLRGLSLNRTHVTDAGLLHLVALPRLYLIDLADTPVTAEGARAFRMTAPRTFVRRR